MNPRRFRWPIILMTIVLIWILMIVVLIERGPRKAAWPAGAAPATTAAPASPAEVA